MILSLGDGLAVPGDSSVLAPAIPLHGNLIPDVLIHNNILPFVQTGDLHIVVYDLTNNLTFFETERQAPWFAYDR